MEILKLVGFGLAAMVMIMLMGEQNKTVAVIMRLLASVLMLMIIVPQLQVVFDVIYKLADKVSLSEGYLSILFKVIGIAYVAEFAYQICKDGGEEAIASKIQLAGKVMILVLAAPIALALIDLITGLL
ncbi:MAG: stage III sporulation protein AD [Cellulosilyticaceae bacterium]